MVAPEEGHSVLVAYFEGDQEQEGLDAVVASVHVIAHEDVVGVWRLASYSEELQQVFELAVNIPADLHQRENILWLGHQL